MQQLHARKTLAAAAAALALAMAAAPPAAAESLAEAMVSALRSSDDMTLARLGQRQADESYMAARGQYRPSLNWNASLNREYRTDDDRPHRYYGVNVKDYSESEGVSNSAGINLSVPLWDFGQTRRAREQAKMDLRQARERYLQSEGGLLQRVVGTYFRVLQARRQLESTESNFEALLEQQRSTQRRFELGAATRTDVISLESAVAGARGGLIATRAGLDSAERSYESLIGNRAGKLELPPELPELPEDVDLAIKIALETHPDVMAAADGLTSAEMNLKDVKASLLPSLEMTARAGVQTSGPDVDNPQISNALSRFSSLGLELSMPIYNYAGGRIASRKRFAIMGIEQARIRLRQTRDGIEESVIDSYAGLDTSRAALEASRLSLAAARLELEATIEEERLGRSTALDVLRARNRFFGEQTSLIGAEIGIYNAAFRVLSSLGQLNAAKLNLPVEQYDPSVYHDLVKWGPPRLSPPAFKLERMLREMGKNGDDV